MEDDADLNGPEGGGQALADHGVRPAGGPYAPKPDEEKQMNLLEHIGELRRRLIYVLAALFIGLVLGLLAAEPVYDYLMSVEPASKLTELHAFSLWDGIGMYMKIAFVVALLIVLPFAFYQLWAFVSPGLKARERRAALGYVPLAFVMLAVGLAFSYFVVFPLAFDFTTHVSRSLGLEETYGIAQYFSFMFNIIVPISLLFELPILVMFLTRIGILNPARLRKMRRYAYFGLIFVGVLVTPPDFISDMLVALPLILLYEFSVYMASSVHRRMQRREGRLKEDEN
jgi:sec-independent protein translocase protein TatC